MITFLCKSTRWTSISTNSMIGFLLLQFKESKFGKVKTLEILTKIITLSFYPITNDMGEMVKYELEFFLLKKKLFFSYTKKLKLRKCLLFYIQRIIFSEV